MWHGGTRTGDVDKSGHVASDASDELSPQRQASEAVVRGLEQERVAFELFSPAFAKMKIAVRLQVSMCCWLLCFSHWLASLLSHTQVLELHKAWNGLKVCYE